MPVEGDVLILGSGIAGLTCALECARAGFQVVLVTKDRLPESSSRYAQGGIIGRGPEDTSELLFEDIVAAGAGQSYFGNDHFAQFAPGMKSIDDALELRGRIFGAFELAELADEDEEIDHLLTFVVVGAGPTGVEMAGQIAELAHRTLHKDFRAINTRTARVVLLDAAGQVLPPFGAKLGEKTKTELEKLGVPLYPRKFDRTDTITALVRAHGAKTGEALEGEKPRTRTAGRILAIRSFGKANFLVISDGQERIQVYIRQDSLPELDFRVYKLLDFGDFVGVEGRLFRTKTKELTVWASTLEFLAKCFLPLPEKWHGLSDVEIRYRQRYLDLMAAHKLNVLHLHLTDDQGWRIEIRKYPRLTETGSWRSRTKFGHRASPLWEEKPHGGHYTQDDIREIVAYAAERHITVVPEIDIPGHSQAAIAAYPELGNTDVIDTTALSVWDTWGINPNVLAPTDNTLRFYEGVFEEVLELFPSEFIHVGGDECLKDQWRQSPTAQQRIRELGLSNEEELQSWFVKQMDTFLASRGRRLVGWDEILEGGLAEGAPTSRAEPLSPRASRATVASATWLPPSFACPSASRTFARCGRVGSTTSTRPASSRRSSPIPPQEPQAMRIKTGPLHRPRMSLSNCLTAD